jgi:hypothetical protein
MGKADVRVTRSLVQYERRMRVDPSGLGLSASTSQLAGSFLFLGAMMEVEGMKDQSRVILWGWYRVYRALDIEGYPGGLCEKMRE